jgi:hypothetical protein
MIVNKEKQTIVTATDEVFTMLGYEPAQLVGKPISILEPTKHKNYYYLLHESYGKICFELCIHFDPLANAKDLEYWLLRPITQCTSNSSSPVTILRLSPFGTIEHAYPCLEFPQTPHELKGQPIMSFIYPSDVRPLCEKLSKIPRRVYTTFRIRWLKFHPKQDQQQEYEWVSFTVMHNPRTNDPQSRPVCIIRPLDQQESSEGILSFAFNMLADYGVNTLYQTLEALHLAIDQGKSYMIEFLAHMVTQILAITCELVGHLEERSHSEEIPSVNVSLDNCVWSVPLYINKTIMQQNNTKKKCCTKRKPSASSKNPYATYWSLTPTTPNITMTKK